MAGQHDGTRGWPEVFFWREKIMKVQPFFDEEKEEEGLEWTTTTETARATNFVVLCRKTSFLVPLNQPVNFYYLAPIYTSA